MSSELPPADASPAPPARWRWPLRAVARAEDGLVVLTLLLMVLLPIIGIVLYVTSTRGISGSTEIVRHGTLVIGMLGGAIAARRNRLLSLATTSLLPAGRLRQLSGIIAGAAAATVAASLSLASYWFVQQTYDAGESFALSIPRWVIQLVMPVGFALIAIRAVWFAGARWQGRALAGGIAAAIVAFSVVTHPQFADWMQRESWPVIDPQRLVIPALLALLVATVLGAPIFALLGGAGLILLWGEQTPIAVIPNDHYSLVVNPSLPTIPLFTLAGYFLAEGGASKRLIDVFSALFGSIRGGPAIVTVLVCAFFTSFTGASGVTILALGGLLLPVLTSASYSERASLGLITGSGAVGMLFPPCLPLVLYAIIAEQPMEKMFLASILPAILLVVVTMGYGVFAGPRLAAGTRMPFHFRTAATAVWNAKWELLLPVVAMGCLFGGFATPVEASAVTALYALATQTLFHRDLNLIRDVPRVIIECGLVVGGVLLILGVAKGLTGYLILAQVPDQVIDWVTSAVHSPLMFLLLLNLVLLLVGCVMDVFSAIIVVVPLIVPIAARFGIDPLHLGVIFLANLELGYLTPPVGLNLFLSSYRFGKPMSAIVRSIIPILIIQLIGVLVITYFPPLTTLLPAWFGKG